MRSPSIAALCLATAAGGRVARADHPTHPVRVDITVTERGFTPAGVAVPAATPIALVFVRKTDKTCAKDVRLVVGDQTIDRALPLGTPVEIDVSFPKAGTLVYACAMDMVHGTITVREAR